MQRVVDLDCNNIITCDLLIRKTQRIFTKNLNIYPQQIANRWNREKIDSIYSHIGCEWCDRTKAKNVRWELVANITQNAYRGY